MRACGYGITWRGLLTLKALVESGEMRPFFWPGARGYIRSDRFFASHLFGGGGGGGGGVY